MQSGIFGTSDVTLDLPPNGIFLCDDFSATARSAKTSLACPPCYTPST